MNAFKTAILIGLTGLLSEHAYSNGIHPVVDSDSADDVNALVDKYLITPSGVENFLIGAPIPFSLSGYQFKERIEEAEGESYPLYTVWHGNEELLRIIPQYDFVEEQYSEKIGQMEIISAKYRTAKGIGVNTTIKEFAQIYPDYYIWYTYINGMYVLENDEDYTVQYILSEKDYKGKTIKVSGEINILDRNSFKPNARISKIRIFGLD